MQLNGFTDDTYKLETYYHYFNIIQVHFTCHCLDKPSTGEWWTIHTRDNPD